MPNNDSSYITVKRLGVPFVSSEVSEQGVNTVAQHAQGLAFTRLKQPVRLMPVDATHRFDRRRVVIPIPAADVFQSFCAYY